MSADKRADRPRKEAVRSNTEDSVQASSTEAHGQPTANGRAIASFTLTGLPQELEEALARGWSIVPIDREVLDQEGRKRPHVSWTPYQEQPPDATDIYKWWHRWPEALWAVITGPVSGLTVLDFDGPEGMTTLDRLGLEPHVHSPRGGAHVHVSVDWPVRTGSRVSDEFPGMDVRGDGGLALFYGERGEGFYRWRSTLPSYQVNDLPIDLVGILEERRKDREQESPAAARAVASGSGAKPEHAYELIARALRKVATGTGRNDVGHWLGQQLWDQGFSQDQVFHWLMRYQQDAPHADHEYTAAEVEATWKQVISRPRRDPWLSDDDAPTYVRLSDVETEHVRWLWPGRVPYRHVTILDGDPGTSKSTVTLDWAARVSRGGTMPDDTPVDEAGVVLVCAEDRLEDTIKPRLKAAKANLDRIVSVTLPVDDKGHVQPLTIPDDLERIGEVIRTTDASLLIIDPITAYLPERINSHNDASVRRALTPLAQFAHEMGVAAVLVRHLNKSGDLKAMYRGGGSIAFTGAARSVLVVAEHPEASNLRVIARVKGNLAAPVPSFAYDVLPSVEYDQPLIQWRGEIDIDADTLVSGGDGRRASPARDDAEAFLRTVLADGPVAVPDIEDEARQAGHSWRTVQRAKEAVAIAERVQAENGQILGWEWRLKNYADTNVIHFDLAEGEE